jgi:predicted Zn-dependent protease
MLADAASRKAVELDDSLPEAHAARAFTLVNMYRFSESEPEFRRAFELNPNYATAHYFYAFGCLAPTNRIEQALAEFNTALSLDPLSSIVNANYAVVLMEARRYPESLAVFQKVLERDPNFFPARYKLSMLYATMGRYSEAVSELAKSRFTKPLPVTPDAKGYLQLMMTEEGSDRSTSIAAAAALAGERDQAFQYLDKAYSNGDNALLISIRLPAFDPLRSDPRYADLMRRLGLPQ